MNKEKNRGKSVMDLPLQQLTADDLTIEEKVGQMLCFAFHGTEYNEQLDRQLKDLKVGGSIFFLRNIENNEQVKKLNKDLQDNAKIPLFIGLDQEGGTVLRITEGITPFPGAMAFSASGRSNYNVCKSVGHDLRSLGFNMVFAPVADVNNNSLNPVINSRSYSDDPEVVSKYVIDAFKGFQDSLVLPTVKHFPGHGDTSVDSHLSLPTVTKEKEELEKIELAPFKAAIKNGIDGVMVAHIVFDKVDSIYPSTLSKKIITEILREEMQFKGLVVTDSLTMGAINNNYSKGEIVEYAVNAGIDLLIFCGKADIEEQTFIYNEFLRKIKEGKISINRVNESVNRLLDYKKKYQCDDMSFSEEKLVINEEYVKEALDISNESITLVEDKQKLFPLKEDDKTLIIFPKIKLFSLVDNANENYKTLSSFFEKDEIIFDSELENLSEIIEKSKNYDKIILCTYNVQKDDHYTKVFNAIDKNKTIVVSMRSPYDYLYLNDLSTYICIYEATSLSLTSLSNCLSSKNQFKGKLPIKKEELL